MSLLSFVLVVAAGLMLTATPAVACMSCTCVEILGVEVCDCVSTLGSENELFDPVVVSFPEVDQEEPTQAEISIYGYQTTDVRNGLACVVAMPEIPGVESIDEVINYNTVTGEPLAHVTFAPSSVPAEELGRRGYEAGVGDTAEPWTSFVSTITGRVENGIPNHFTIKVTLDGGTTAGELVQNLRNYGGFFTASSDQAGHPNGGHTFLKRFSNFSVMALYPPQQEPQDGPQRGERLAPVLP